MASSKFYHFIPFSKSPHTKTTIVPERNTDVTKANEIVNISDCKKSQFAMFLRYTCFIFIFIEDTFCGDNSTLKFYLR